MLFVIILLAVTAGLAAQQFLFKKKTVLFLCVHNTFRSQMAEAYFNKFAREKGLRWQAKSAGFLAADKINEKAIILMAEEGIDLADKKPKLLQKEMTEAADKIVVVCKECEEKGLCTALPKTEKDIEYWRLDNPAEMELDQAREIRNQVKEKTLNLINNLN